MTRTRIGLVATFGLLVGVWQPANADGWTSSFTITGLWVSLADNFQYRVYGMPTQASCTNGTTWAYLNQSDSGASWYAAAILAAYHAGKPVQLNVQTVNGYCHIIEMFESG